MNAWVSLPTSTMLSKGHTLGYQNCKSSQILIFDEYVKVKVREYSNTQVIIWVNTILNHIDIRASLFRWKGSYMVYRSECQ